MTKFKKLLDLANRVISVVQDEFVTDHDYMTREHNELYVELDGIFVEAYADHQIDDCDYRSGRDMIVIQLVTTLDDYLNFVLQQLLQDEESVEDIVNKKKINCLNTNFEIDLLEHIQHDVETIKSLLQELQNLTNSN